MFEVTENLLLPEESNLKKLNFLGLISCPMRQIFKDSLEDALQKHRKQTGITLNSFVPSACHHIENVEELLDNSDIDDFPDMFSSLGFNYMFKNNIKTLMSRNEFSTPTQVNLSQPFIDAGCIDPQNEYGVYSASPVLFIVDIHKLGDLPIPTKWLDLLNPIYKDNIIVSGSKDEIFNDIALYFYKEFSMDGIKTLSKNIKDLWHPVEMAKTAGTKNSKGVAIYIIPTFFANSCPKQENIKIIWPEEGAFISPNTILVKKSKLQQLKPLIDLLTGSEFGEKCTGNHYYSTNPAVPINIPIEAKFKWLGWNFIRSNDIEKLSEEINTTFIETFKKSH